MGFGDRLKEIYYSAEESWYSSLDKIDEHLPIYKIVDRIDDVAPSFALTLLLILVVLLLLIISMLGLVGEPDAILKLTIIDPQGQGVGNAQVTIQGIDETFYSNDFGLLEGIKVPYGKTINVTAQKDNKKTTLPIKILFSETVEQITLNVDSISFSARTLMFLNEQTNSLITDSLTLSYSCSDGPNPESTTITSGTDNVNVPSNCGQLTLTVTSQNYETKTQTISTSSTQIILKEIIPKEKGEAIILLESNGQRISEELSVMAYRADYPYVPEETVTSTNGSATFNILEGDYIFKTKAENGFLAGTTQTVTVQSNDTITKTINLTKSVLGQISVEVKRGSTKMNDVLVTLRKGNSEITNKRTDTNGMVIFEVGQEGPFFVIATKDGYCEDIKEVQVGDNVVLNLQTDNGNCGGTLKVRVIDQDDKAINYARVIIFHENEDDTYKSSYADKITDFNGKVDWAPVKYTGINEKYKIFAYKGDYSGWSNAKEFTAINSGEEIIIQLELPLATVNVKVKDKYDEPIIFAEVQLFEEYGNTKITGKKIIENTNGTISFQVKAGQKIYAVVGKEGFESYMTLPKLVKGNNQVNYEVTLTKPPVEEIAITPIGLFKNDLQVLRAQPGEEYLAVFEIVAPKRYSELGFFARVGEENISKTELDRLYIKEILAPGQKVFAANDIGSESGYGASYNPPKGYSIDSEYRNLDESKWGQVIWTQYGYEVGRIRVGVLIKIKENAKMNEQLKLGYRVWGNDSGYERDPMDEQLGTTFSNNIKNNLYAITKTQYIWIGTESLCETQGEHSFCITSTIKDEDGIISSFDTSADVKNNTDYELAIKLYNASQTNFENTKIRLENTEENLFLKDYYIINAQSIPINGTINNYITNWMDTSNFKKQTEISFTKLEVIPQKTGYAPLILRLRDSTSILFEKIFNFNVLSDKKMKAEYMFDDKYQSDLPKIVSGKKQILTIRVKNIANNLEINGARIKLYDRFGNKLLERETNSIGIGTIEIPASLPGELLKISIEKSEYETLEIELKINEDIVDVTPTTLDFTVNPQTKKEDVKKVKIENKTGFDLTIKEIRYEGKTKGLISEMQMESYFDSFKGLKIQSNDYEEIDFKVISARIIPMADDIEGKFQIIVGNDFRTWIKEIDTKIRIGLGKDVDNASCLEVTVNSWTATTQGEEIEFGFEIRNNCLVDGIPANLKNLGAMLNPSGNLSGSFSVTTNGAYTGLSRGYTRVFKPSVDGQEIIPVILRFTPFGGTIGTTTGTIVFETINKTDSKDQVLNTTIDYSIDIIDSSCMVIGSDLIRVEEEGSGSFSITNNCPQSASFQIDSELTLDNKIFTLSPNESKDVTITRNKGDLPGAYNNLVHGRIGNQKQELIGNVKAILDDTQSCFSLSRYEYDVYDSPYNDSDGIDRGYLRNDCTSKTVTASVSGEKDFDWDKVINDMIIGGVIGLLTSKEEGWLSKIFGSSIVDSVSGMLNKANNEFKTRVTREQLSVKTQVEEERGKLVESFNLTTQDIIEMENYFNSDKLQNTTDCNNCKKTQLDNLAKFKLSVGKAHLDTNTRFNQIQSGFDKKVKDWQNEINALYEINSKKVGKNETSAQELKKEYEEEVEEVSSKLDAEIAKINEEVTKIRKDTIEKIQKDFNTTYKPKIKTCIETCKPKAEVTTTPETKPTTPLAADTIKENIVATPKPQTAIISEGNLSPSSTDKYTEEQIEGSNYLVYTVKEGDTLQKIANENLEIYTLNPDSTQINNRASQIAAFNGKTTDQMNNLQTGQKIYIPDYYNKDEGATIPAIDGADTDPINIYGIEFEVTKIEENKKTQFFAFIKISNSKALNAYGNTREELTKNLEEIVNEIRKGENEDISYNDLFNNTSSTESNKNNPSKETSPFTAQFILASRANSFGFGNLGDILGNNLGGIAGGLLGGNALYGALISGLLSIVQDQNLSIEYTRNFNVSLVDISNISLQSEGGVSVSVGEKTFDYDDYYSDLVGGGTSTIQGLTEIRELSFVGGGQTTDTPYKPFTGILTVNGTEKIYEEDYNYKGIEKAVKDRGELNKKKQNWFLELLNPVEEPTAVMQEEDLIVKETLNFEKKYHLLFDSYEYVECGPKTYPCQAIQASNCKVGSKTGITGANAVPKMLLNWNWNNISETTCDESNSDYVYCDVTQATISTLKKIYYLKNFFNTNTLSKCPTSTDTSARTNTISTNALDVGITSIQISETTNSAKINVRVETNNKLELMAGIKYSLERDSGEEISITCDEEKQPITSYKDYSCELNKSEIGTGKFIAKATLNLGLCEGCENNDVSNDTLTTNLILGEEGVQTCQEYSTKSISYFEKVLSANNILTSEQGSNALKYSSFTINLMKDGFSEDFRMDLDNYLMQFAVAPTEYTDTLRELFLKKFTLESPMNNNTWTAGKYSARLIINFANENWQWNDINDIESIILKIEPWGRPDVEHAIYDIPINGMVGINSDDGRNGYGTNYISLTEKPVIIVEGSGADSTIKTETNPASNPLSTAKVSVDETFYTMNSWAAKRGNVLTINRTGDEVNLTFSPSIAVPAILNINRTNSLDAYAYYSVEIDGQPQNVGPSMITWTGIGQGCTDFSGVSMNTWDDSMDLLNESGDGYGLRWNNTIASGTASFYGVFYVPEQKSSVLLINSAMQNAFFETPFGNGTTIPIGSGTALRSIKNVFDAVKNESVCVAGGDYFWNNKQVIANEMQSQIDAKENTCITIS
ncbi:MAG: LysM peptidoglycan-binding domain-containing protein [Candidatus ainarchaeum sp.]|nr:LysM peptidoglycan-binding domain-containing protein [Candidatus ainarchaeum sp.]